MDFVDAQRRAQGVALPPLFQPSLVRPLEFAAAPHDGRVLGRGLEVEAVRIGLHADLPMSIAHLEFVMRPFAHARNEDLPHP